MIFTGGFPRFWVFLMVVILQCFTQSFMMACSRAPDASHPKKASSSQGPLFDVRLSPALNADEQRPDAAVNLLKQPFGSFDPLEPVLMGEGHQFSVLPVIWVGDLQTEPLFINWDDKVLEGQVIQAHYQTRFLDLENRVTRDFQSRVAHLDFLKAVWFVPLQEVIAPFPGEGLGSYGQLKEKIWITLRLQLSDGTIKTRDLVFRLAWKVTAPLHEVVKHPQSGSSADVLQNGRILIRQERLVLKTQQSQVLWFRADGRGKMIRQVEEDRWVLDPKKFKKAVKTDLPRTAPGFLDLALLTKKLKSLPNFQKPQRKKRSYFTQDGWHEMEVEIKIDGLEQARFSLGEGGSWHSFLVHPEKAVDLLWWVTAPASFCSLAHQRAEVLAWKEVAVISYKEGLWGRNKTLKVSLPRQQKVISGIKLQGLAWDGHWDFELLLSRLGWSPLSSPQTALSELSLLSLSKGNEQVYQGWDELQSFQGMSAATYGPWQEPPCQ